MAVPDYESLMVPLLQILADRQEHMTREAIETVAIRIGLTEADRRELLPSGRQPKFENRLGWARVYMTKAGLIEATGRAVFRITQRGLDFLAAHPQVINAKLLEEFPEFREFRAPTEAKRSPRPRVRQDTTQSPEEALETGYVNLRQQVAQDILSKVKAASPKFFERLVVDLLVAMGYGGSREDAGSTVGQSGDGGIDGIIKEDKLGLDNIYVQAKRWDGPVGRQWSKGLLVVWKDNGHGKGC